MLLNIEFGDIRRRVIQAEQEETEQQEVMKEKHLEKELHQMGRYVERNLSVSENYRETYLSSGKIQVKEVTKLSMTKLKNGKICIVKIYYEFMTTKQQKGK